MSDLDKDLDFIATEGICVGRYAVLSFAVPGMDEHGAVATKYIIPLPSFGRFRGDMVWGHGGRRIW